MKTQEAINILEKYKSIPTSEDVKKAYDTAISAPEKQIPKKVVPTQQPCKSRFACSICDKRLYSKQKFCDRCGQALDWSDSE